MAQNEFKYTPSSTIKKYNDSRTKYFEAKFYAKDNPKSAVAQKKLSDALAKLNALGKIARNQSITREGYLPKSPSPSNLPRSAAKPVAKKNTVRKAAPKKATRRNLGM